MEILSRKLPNMLFNINMHKLMSGISIKRYLSLSTQHLSSHKTVYHDFHVNNGGKMVEFAGYSMPVQYGNVGISMSHKHVRQHCGLFDVSHMLQTKIYGKDNIKFIESLIVADVQELKENTGTLSLFINDNGGIIDDLICSKTNNGYLYVVSNAGCREKDLAQMKTKLSEFKSSGFDVDLEIIDDHALLAVQGPTAVQALQPLVEYKLENLYFMNTTEMDILGVTCRVTRCGYTGEDGVEISIPNGKAVELCENLLASKVSDVQMAGLGARDSLRLEAGLCLYGNDIDDSTTPIEAGLAWTIGKRRRQAKDFPAADIILKQLKEKPSRRRVGLVSKGPPPRSHCLILDAEGNQIGEVTSGVPSPSLGVNIAMAYIPASMNKVGAELTVQIRNKKFTANIAKMPFVKCNYHSPK